MLVTALVVTACAPPLDTARYVELTVEGPGATPGFEGTDDGSPDAVTDPTSGAATHAGPGADEGRGEPRSAASVPRATGAGGGARTDDATERRDRQHRTVPMGRGVSAGEIHIGFQVAADLGASYAAVGAEDAELPTERNYIDALVTWVNEQGGLAGRRVVPVLHETDQLNGTWASQAQAACATFTEDHEVFAVVTSAVGGSDAFVACTAAKGTPVIEQSAWLFDTPTHERYAGWLYQPGRMRPDRWAAAWVDELVGLGYFEDGQVGLVRFDAPVFTRTAERFVRPALARHGITLASEVALSTPAGVSGFGRLNAEIGNAILRFRTLGVTHVMVLGYAGMIPYFWMPQAESAGYRPRYALTTNENPPLLAVEAPAAQLRRAVGVGWAVANDVNRSEDPGGNANRERCWRILEAAGIQADRAYFAQSACDGMFFLQAVTEAAPSLDAAGFRAAVDALGDRYQSPVLVRTRLGPGHHDGGAAVRAFGFDGSCGCFRYRGPPREVVDR